MNIQPVNNLLPRYYMRKIIAVLFPVFLCVSNGSAQQYQRMLIAKADLSGLEIGSNQMHEVNSYCLDRFRKPPKENAPLNYILNDASNMVVLFTDTRTRHQLLDLLGKPKGITITGGASYSFVKVTNLTDHPIKFITDAGLEVGTTRESYISTNESIFDSRSSNNNALARQNTLWANNTLQNFAQLGYHLSPEETTRIKSANLKNNLLPEKNITDEIELLTKKFQKDHGITPPDGDIYGLKTQRIFTASYNNYLAVHGAADNAVQDTFRKFRLGFSGSTGDEFIKHYIKVKGLKADASWDEIQISLRLDYVSRLYYIYDAASDTYVQYYRPKSFPGLLFRKTDSVAGSFQQFEDELSLKKLTQANTFVFNLFAKNEDRDVYRLLSGQFPGNRGDGAINSAEALQAKIKASQAKFVFCFGNYRAGQLFITVNGKEVAYDAAALYKIGEDAGAEVFVAGYEDMEKIAGSNKGAYNDILSNIANNINKAGSLGQFFKNLIAGNNVKYSYRYEVLNNAELMKLHIYPGKPGFSTDNNPAVPDVVITFPSKYLFPVQ